MDRDCKRRLSYDGAGSGMRCSASHFGLQPPLRMVQLGLGFALLYLILQGTMSKEAKRCEAAHAITTPCRA